MELPRRLAQDQYPSPVVAESEDEDSESVGGSSSDQIVTPVLGEIESPRIHRARIERRKSFSNLSKMPVLFEQEPDAVPEPDADVEPQIGGQRRHSTGSCCRADSGISS
ncbi:unnamed protein product [Polarella glacialis]|uniref:Uncharacterized protein n=1 Tax=Polarella glacialis TaxID=89957 RepID=A0A813DNR2_POLGL|nr:unnamed protein product [Polarella glacialis]